jgi:hypothetical protein
MSRREDTADRSTKNRLALQPIARFNRLDLAPNRFAGTVEMHEIFCACFCRSNFHDAAAYPIPVDRIVELAFGIRLHRWNLTENQFIPQPIARLNRLNPAPGYLAVTIEMD